MIEQEWDLLLSRIKDERCTPFLGAGACTPTLPLGREIALQWSRKFNYPLSDRDNLPRVAQYLALSKDPMFPKEELIRHLKSKGHPDFNATHQIHRVLAKLPLPIYLTTNYDDFMTQALQLERKDVFSDYCRWNAPIQKKPSRIRKNYHPEPQNPFVYYLHGTWDVPQSIVLTGDDYIDFLANVNKDMNKILHYKILEAFADSSLLFIGYSLDDLSFRTIFRGLIDSVEKGLRRISVSVQLLPTHDTEKRIKDILNILRTQFVKDQNEEKQGKVSETIQALEEIKLDQFIFEKIHSLETQLMDLTADPDQKQTVIKEINALQEAVAQLHDLRTSQKALEYLELYFKKIDICVYWGDTKDFTEELWRRWTDYNKKD